ncbi:MAG: SGNH/GDSL hydrolase family protein [Leptospiraceae bacterium]|nr:SGNH/GDSL hydrolase family protein [Leptospiraceae bacterium]
MVTFMGDSRSDLVDFPGYGWFSWEFYLGLTAPDVPWDVQNLGVSTWTTGAVHGELIECVRNGAGTYKTAKNVVMEIGGNDYIANLLFGLVLMPWMQPRIQDRVVRNTALLVKILRHPVYNKNVLILGNPPAVTSSPTLGPLNAYFHPVDNLANLDRESNRPYGNVFKTYQHELELLQDQHANDPYKTVSINDSAALAAVNGHLFDLFALDVARLLNIPLADQAFDAALQLNLGNLQTNILNPLLGNKEKCPFPWFPDAVEWYCAWLTLNSTDMGLSALSIAMALHQGPLEAAVRAEGAEFLPLYHLYIRPDDCAQGACYVGNYHLYRDMVHENHWGYFLRGGQIANKLKALGWQGSPPPGYSGLPDKSVFATPAEEEQFIEEHQHSGVQETPNNNDWIILCFLAGIC